MRDGSFHCIRVILALGSFAGVFVFSKSGGERGPLEWVCVTVRIVATLFCLLSGCAAAVTPAVPVSVHILPNGMKVVALEDHNIPNVALYLIYRAGSRNERPGSTGISHFLEHMMFNGSKKYGPHEFDRIMEKNGGSNNAFTTRDVTVYSDWFSKSALDLILSMEAERMQHLSFDPAIVESERKVVIAERRTTVENDPFGFLLEQLYATLYKRHPYRWPVLGLPPDIQSWTIPDVREYYERGYGPNNCVMTAVGDFRAAELFHLVELHFAAIPRRDRPAPVDQAEPPQDGERRLDIHRLARAPQQLFGYHVPASSHPDHWALEVANSMLTYGHSSRLYRRLIQHDHSAVAVTSWLRFSFDPSEWIISIDLRQGATPGKADEGLDEEILRLQTSLVTSHELKAAKNKLLTEHARATRTNSGIAEQLGNYEVFFRDYRKLFEMDDEIGKVTAKDVQQVARKYLQKTNRAVATLNPVAYRTQEAGQ